MPIMPRVTELLHQVELRNQRHPMRLYGTLARGAVWSCLDRMSWAMPDLARILRWGVERRLIGRAEARRLWRLVQLALEPDTSAAPVLPGRSPPQEALRTELHVLHGLARPWQEWATEPLERTQEESR